MKADDNGGALPRVHFVAKYIQSPLHPVKVTLVGAGGNGGQMLSALARIDTALKSLSHPGLHVTVWDPDTVQEPNIGRQLFSFSDLGQNKAVTLVTRFNRFYGTGWDAVPERICADSSLGNIVITCVDNVAARRLVAKMFHQGARKTANNEDRTYYWLDLGNARNTGQAILGSIPVEQPKSGRFKPVATLPALDREVSLSKVRDDDSGPSCSLAEALTKQDLFINSSLTQLAGSLLWSLFMDVAMDVRGFYINLETFKVSPIKV